MTPTESAEFVRAVRDKLYPNAGPLKDINKAFNITRYVAHYLRTLGYGVVRAKSGSANNADGYTCDVIAKPDGFHVDILEDGEGRALARWQPHTKQEEMNAIKPRWEAAPNLPDIFDDKPNNGDNSTDNPVSDNNGTHIPDNEILISLLIQIVENQKINTEALLHLENTIAKQNEILTKAMNDLKAEVSRGIPIRFGR